jgi:hypothetical protein
MMVRLGESFAPVPLGSLFPGATGRVWLTRVALRLREPALLLLPPDAVLAGEQLERVRRALQLVKEG